LGSFYFQFFSKRAPVIVEGGGATVPYDTMASPSLVRNTIFWVRNALLKTNRNAGGESVYTGRVL